MLDHARLRGPAVAGAALAAVAGLGAAATGCGSDKSKSSGGGGAASAPAMKHPQSAPVQKLSLEADEDGGLYFKPKKLQAKAGRVSLVMENPKTTGKEHGIAVKGNGVDDDGPIVKPGKTAAVTATLKPGKYTFYCPYDGHAKQGMKGTLTVK